MTFPSIRQSGGPDSLTVDSLRSLQVCPWVFHGFCK